MTQKTTPPEIERIKFKDLSIDNLYSGRSEKEINENAKEKTKELASAGGWNPAMPGQYFIGEDGKKHLIAGFSRVKASLINGEDHGYFVQVEGDEVDHLLACETTNSVKPLSPLSRGARYSELRDGVLADDFVEALADPKNAAHWKRQPMTAVQIADRIGKTSAWVGKCIAIFEAPPEIRDMLETEKIAVTIAEGAKSLVDKYYNGSEAKQVAICRKAFANARADGKDTAMKQHFEAIKAEFIPEKKLVADGKTEKQAKNESGETQEAPEASSNTSEAESSSVGATGDSEADNLFKTTMDDVKEISKKDQDKRKKVLATVLLECSEEYSWSATDSDIDGAVEKILAAIVPF